ncbi:hypothetical protein V8E54_009891 [Elaphomyces granulatus]
MAALLGFWLPERQQPRMLPEYRGYQQLYASGAISLPTFKRPSNEPVQISIPTSRFACEQARSTVTTSILRAHTPSSQSLEDLDPHSAPSKKRRRLRSPRFELSTFNCAASD